MRRNEAFWRARCNHWQVNENNVASIEDYTEQNDDMDEAVSTNSLQETALNTDTADENESIEGKNADTLHSSDNSTQKPVITNLVNRVQQNLHTNLNVDNAKESSSLSKNSSRSVACKQTGKRLKTSFVKDDFQNRDSLPTSTVSQEYNCAKKARSQSDKSQPYSNCVSSLNLILKKDQSNKDNWIALASEKPNLHIATKCSLDISYFNAINNDKPTILFNKSSSDGISKAFYSNDDVEKEVPELEINDHNNPINIINFSNNLENHLCASLKSKIKRKNSVIRNTAISNKDCSTLTKRRKLEKIDQTSDRNINFTDKLRTTNNTKTKVFLDLSKVSNDVLQEPKIQESILNTGDFSNGNHTLENQSVNRDNISNIPLRVQDTLPQLISRNCNDLNVNNSIYSNTEDIFDDDSNSRLYIVTPDNSDNNEESDTDVNSILIDQNSNIERDENKQNKSSEESSNSNTENEITNEEPQMQQSVLNTSTDISKKVRLVKKFKLWFDDSDSSDLENLIYNEQNPQILQTHNKLKSSIDKRINFVQNHERPLTNVTEEDKMNTETKNFTLSNNNMHEESGIEEDNTDNRNKNNEIGERQLYDDNTYENDAEKLISRSDCDNVEVIPDNLNIDLSNNNVEECSKDNCTEISLDTPCLHLDNNKDKSHTNSNVTLNETNIELQLDNENAELETDNENTELQTDTQDNELVKENKSNNLFENEPKSELNDQVTETASGTVTNDDNNASNYSAIDSINNSGLADFDVIQPAINKEEILPDSIELHQHLEGGDFDFLESMHKSKSDSEYSDEYEINSDCDVMYQYYDHTTDHFQYLKNESEKVVGSKDYEIIYESNEENRCLLESDDELKVSKTKTAGSSEKLPELYNKYTSNRVNNKPKIDIKNVIDVYNIDLPTSDDNYSNISDDNVIIIDDVPCDNKTTKISIHVNENLKKTEYIDLDSDNEEIITSNNLTAAKAETNKVHTYKEPRITTIIKNVKLNNKIPIEEAYDCYECIDLDDYLPLSQETTPANGFDNNLIKPPTNQVSSFIENSSTVTTTDTTKQIPENVTLNVASSTSNKELLENITDNSIETAEKVSMNIASINSNEIGEKLPESITDNSKQFVEINTCINNLTGNSELLLKKEILQNPSYATVSAVPENINDVEMPTINNSTVITNIPKNTLDNTPPQAKSETDHMNSSNVIKHGSSMCNMVDEKLALPFSVIRKVDLNDTEILRKFNLTKEIVAPEESNTEVITTHDNHNDEIEIYEESLKNVFDELVLRRDHLPSDAKDTTITSKNQTNSVTNGQSANDESSSLFIKVSGSIVEKNGNYDLLKDMNINVVNDVDAINTPRESNFKTHGVIKVRDLNTMLANKPAQKNHVVEIRIPTIEASSNTNLNINSDSTMSNERIIQNTTSQLSSQANLIVNKSVSVHLPEGAHLPEPSSFENELDTQIVIAPIIQIANPNLQQSRAPIIQVSNPNLQQSRAPIIQSSNPNLQQSRAPIIQSSNPNLQQSRAPIIQISNPDLQQSRAPIIQISNPDLQQSRAPIIQLSNPNLQQSRAPIIQISNPNLQQSHAPMLNSMHQIPYIAVSNVVATPNQNNQNLRHNSSHPSESLARSKQNINQKGQKHVIYASHMYTDYFANTVTRQPELPKELPNTGLNQSTNIVTVPPEINMFTLTVPTLDDLRLPAPYTLNPLETLTQTSDKMVRYKRVLLEKIDKILKSLKMSYCESFIDSLENYKNLTNETLNFHCKLIQLIQCITAAAKFSEDKNPQLIITAIVNSLEKGADADAYKTCLNKLWKIYNHLKSKQLISSIAESQEPLLTEMEELCNQIQPNTVIAELTQEQQNQLNFQIKTYYKIYKTHREGKKRRRYNKYTRQLKSNSTAPVVPQMNIIAKNATKPNENIVSNSLQKALRDVRGKRTSKSIKEISSQSKSDSQLRSSTSTSINKDTSSTQENTDPQNEVVQRDQNQQINSICLKCDKTSEIVCNSCKVAGYCSRECQQIHWAEEHFKICIKLRFS